MKRGAQTIYFLFAYLAVRIFSYVFPPLSEANTVVSLLVVCLAAYFLIKKDIRGWYLVAGELILGGSGNFLSAFNLSLRSWLLIVSIGIYTFSNLPKLKTIVSANKKIAIILASLGVAVVWAIGRGVQLNHDPKLIISAAVPYLFFLYYFPLRDLYQSYDFKEFVTTGVLVAIFGNLLFIGFTFIGFSSHFFELQGTYYHWFRDVANGKITDLHFNFYRIVLNEQLLLVPLLLYYTYKQIIENKQAQFWSSRLAFILLPIIFSINLTRIYLVAFVMGLGFLFSRRYWRRWLAVSALALVIFFASFTSIHLLASRGKSLGWELFGLRLQSIVAPSLEDSSLSRLMLLPSILKKISSHPLAGNGFGDTVTVYSPTLHTTITTPQFDWGYLQLIDAFGLIALFAWMTLLVFMAGRLMSPQSPRWCLASLVAILVSTLTGPTLFHVLGITWVTYLLATGSEM